ncbi:MAG: glycolate oxidase subunit GlcE [Gammaproteobacteria bacterium]|nr:glycolate oxidase subunit GlcE [Gammaproteobacteria bacterium]
MPGHDATAELVDRVREATARRAPLRIVGGDTKRFLGRDVQGDRLEVAAHCGIVSYDPAELVITARAGTPLSEVMSELAARGQRLPFEPPSFGAAATVGGTVACGLSGPARASAGPLRDYLLGVRVLTGDGKVLRFGGEVMKNVAGYDVARTMAGAFGTLGVLLEVSLKVLPAPPATRTIALELDAVEALVRLEQLAATALPLTASCWTGGTLSLRFEGTARTLDEVESRVGGWVVEDADGFWRSVREHEHPFFRDRLPLWRLHVPAASPLAPAATDTLIEWNGLQRWCVGGSQPLFDSAAVGGNATLFRADAPVEGVFARPAPALLRLHARLKEIFDPAGVLNPGRMYAEI